MLAQVLRPVKDSFNHTQFPDLIVGLDDPDDAAVWRLDENRGLVATTDYFTPVVDDPYDYGAIAAANALSDVYAMGGQPFLALNIAALPPDLPASIGAEILRGGAEKTRQAGVVLAGGHTIQDKEPKYGLVALGFVDLDSMITKSNAQPGDVLVLTKPVGFGTITTALKQGKADAQDVAAAVEWMKTLNNISGSLAVENGVRAGTDITGFGLLGHAWEISSASSVKLVFEFGKIPILDNALKYAKQWIFPGGSTDNRLNYRSNVEVSVEIDEYQMMLLYDAQTSGGLLLCLASEKLDDFLEQAKQSNQPVWTVGRIETGSGIKIV
jgi:selenide,water dikinase